MEIPIRIIPPVYRGFSGGSAQPVVGDPNRRLATERSTSGTGSSGVKWSIAPRSTPPPVSRGPATVVCVDRVFRFGVSGGFAPDGRRLRDLARRAETIGYSTFGMADHFMLPLAPLIALQAVADATTSIRVTQTVLAQDMRHPAVVAKELATLDVLSAGRLEIGLGAGWMADEFARAGMPFPPATTRIARMEESIHVLKGLFADGPFSYAGAHFQIDGLEGTPKPLQRPHPPIMVGGGGAKVLAAAARSADIIQVLPGPITGGSGVDISNITPGAFSRRIDWIREQAGERFHQVELGALLLQLVVTDDKEAAEERFLAGLSPAASGTPPQRSELLASPLVAIGSLTEVCEKLQATRRDYGLSYFSCPVGARPEALAPVIELLAGT